MIRSCDKPDGGNGANWQNAVQAWCYSQAFIGLPPSPFATLAASTVWQSVIAGVVSISIANTPGSGLRVITVNSSQARIFLCEWRIDSLPDRRGLRTASVAGGKNK